MPLLFLLILFFIIFRVQFAFNMDQALSIWGEWLGFNRVNARARKGIIIGPACLHFRYCYIGIK